MSTKPLPAAIYISITCLNGMMRNEHGLYRIIPSAGGAVECEGYLRFPGIFRADPTGFGYDWQGSAFAVDSGRLEQGEPGVLMFEPHTAEAFQIPSNIQTFHDVELIEDDGAVLVPDGYAAWRGGGGAEPSYQQCIGYKKPLFLGGEDTIENFELSDLDVYWHIIGRSSRR